eukprot:Hpha_TRINITY_DN24847_c0_g1::TRINITY_DN24847_c0_g1_i1::g.97276::m.97276
MSIVLLVAVGYVAVGAVDMVKWQKRRESLCLSKNPHTLRLVWGAMSLKQGILCAGDEEGITPVDSCLFLQPENYMVYSPVLCAPSAGKPRMWLYRFLEKHRNGKVVVMGDSMAEQ